jgi:hypothetical protein
MGKLQEIRKDQRVVLLGNVVIQRNTPCRFLSFAADNSFIGGGVAK